MLFFALNGSDELGRRIAEAGGFDLAPHEEREYEGGEHKARPLVSVRGRDVYVLHGLQGTEGMSANDRLLRLLFFIATCKENGAARVTAIAPYLAFSRKDRQTKPRDPVTTRYVASLFEAVGTDCMVTLDVHMLPAFQNAFRCRSVHLETRRLFAEAICAGGLSGQTVVVSPDAGGIKRAQLFREMLAAVAGREIGFGFMEKRRAGGEITGSLFAGDVDGRDVFVVDDMIVGGGTMMRTAEACLERGAASVRAVATHALMNGAAVEGLAASGLTQILVTDSTVPFPDACETLGERLRVVSAASLIAAAVERLHGGGSISDLLAEPAG